MCNKVRKTSEQFIEEAKNVHDNYYDYSLVNYKGIKERVTIICPLHENFEQTPYCHINRKQGCCKCGRIRTKVGLSKSQKDFIKEIKSKHNDFYNYNEVIYKGVFEEIDIICPKHGLFIQIAHNHLRGSGCPICAESKRSKNSTITKDIYITSVNIIHNFKYTYDNINYKGSQSYINVTCKKHGDFSILASNHKSGYGCVKCSNEEKSLKKRDTKDIFLNKLNLKGITLNIIGDYINNITLVIAETEFGLCEVLPSNLLAGKSPSINTATEKDKYYVAQFKKVHGDRYNYDKVKYKNSNTKVNIVCKEHGDFWQIPQSHLSGSGCLSCNTGGYSRTDYIRQAKGREGKLYIIKCFSKEETFYKIGITFNTVKIRYCKKDSMPYEYEIIYQHTCDAGCVWDLEKQLHKNYKIYQYFPKDKFQGYTECFNMDLPIDEIISYLNSI